VKLAKSTTHVRFSTDLPCKMSMIIWPGDILVFKALYYIYLFLFLVGRREGEVCLVSRSESDSMHW